MKISVFYAKSIALLLIAITSWGLHRAIAKDLNKMESGFDIYRVVNGNVDDAQHFKFQHFETKLLIRGAFSPIPIIRVSAIAQIDVASREIGGAPVTGILVRFLPGAGGQASLLNELPEDQNVLIVFRGLPRALISVYELRNIITKSEKLFVAIPVQTIDEANALEHDVEDLALAVKRARIKLNR